jgi:hypothetical protein
VSESVFSFHNFDSFSVPVRVMRMIRGLRIDYGIAIDSRTSGI